MAKDGTNGGKRRTFQEILASHASADDINRQVANIGANRLPAFLAADERRKAAKGQGEPRSSRKVPLEDAGSKALIPRSRIILRSISREMRRRRRIPAGAELRVVEYLSSEYQSTHVAAALHQKGRFKIQFRDALMDTEVVVGNGILPMKGPIIAMEMQAKPNPGMFARF